jgi:hypothetical protein
LLLTLWCVAIVLGGLFAFGVPLRWLLQGGRPLGKREWLEAPFLGAAAPVLVLHNLVYFDVPIRRAAPWIWLGVAGLWAVMALHRQVLPSLRSLPRGALLAGLVVFCVQGLGLFLLGADRYLGRANSDHFNYVSFAQLLSDYPYRLAPQVVGHTPYLLDPIKILRERIGVMLLLGWFSQSAMLDCKTLFGPTILLAPCLVVLPAYAVARGASLSHIPALLAAVTAGVVPGATLVHLDCFMGQALGIPSVFFCLLALYDLARAPSVGRVVLTAAFLSTGNAFYTEFLPLFAGLVVLVLGGALLLRATRWLPGLACLLAVPALAFLLNPLFAPTAYLIFLRVANITTVGNPYPYALELSGQGSLWVGDLWALREGEWARCVSWFGLGLTVAAALGLLRLAAGHLRAAGRCVRVLAYRRSLLLAGCLIAVASLPGLVILCKGTQCPYQVFKLMQTVSPVLVLGVGLVLLPARRLVPATAQAALPWTWPQRLAVVVPLLALLGVCGYGTQAMARQVGDPLPQVIFRSSHHVPCHPDWCEMAARLRKAPRMNLILAAGPGVFFNSYPAYFARRHQVWLTDPTINDGWRIDVRMPQWAHVLDLNTVPWDDVHLLTGVADRSCTLIAGDCTLEWGNVLFRQWKLGPGPVVLRTHVEGQVRLGHGATPNTNTLTLGTELIVMEVWASLPCHLRLRGTFAPAVTLPPGESVRVQVSARARHVAWVTCGPGRQEAEMPLPQGKSYVGLQCFPSLGVPGGPALAVIPDLSLHLTKSPPQQGPIAQGGKP